jgi:hypothetical protein
MKRSFRLKGRPVSVSSAILIGTVVNSGTADRGRASLAGTGRADAVTLERYLGLPSWRCGTRFAV